MGMYTDQELFTVLEYSARALGASEEEILEFTRCVRPNGSVYGTRGKCRKGTQSERGISSSSIKNSILDSKYQSLIPKDRLKVNPDPNVPFHKWWQENKEKLQLPVSKEFRASKAPLSGIGSEPSGHSFKDLYNHTINSLLLTYYRKKHEKLSREAG